MTTAPVTVVILTFNEADNLAQALGSVCGWAYDVFVLDSHSTDATRAVAARHDCQVFCHAFESYARQRNHALDHLPFRTDWVLFLDADEIVTPELRSEIGAVLANGPAEDGFFVNRRLIWMDRWIRRGIYPSWLLRLFRRSRGRYGDRPVNEHVVVNGAIGYLQHDLLHQDRKGVRDWVAKHMRYAEYEAAELLRTPGAEFDVQPSLWGDQVARKRWVRVRVWQRCPPLVRPLLYFAYRYVLRGGWLDGTAGFTYHCLQAFWYPLMIDVRYLELKRTGR